MKIALLHNAVADSDSAADRDVLVQAAAVEDALRSLGHQPRRVAATLNLELVEETLALDRPDIVFNLVESLGGSDRLAHLAAALLEDLDLRYTGTPAAALHLTNNKPLAKAHLRNQGLLTPDWLLCGEAHAALAPPYIIKAMWEHASLGLDDHSVIAAGDGSTVCEQIASRSRQLGQACFAEQFIAGREFNLSLIATTDGPRVLPPAEIDFSAFPPGKPHIVGYAAKWNEAAPEYVGTPRKFDFSATDAPLLDWLRSLAVDCWNLFGLAGYARVDFRVDSQGQPWILEVNANPCLSPDAGFAAALQRADVPLVHAVEWILADATRHSKPPVALKTGPDGPTGSASRVAVTAASSPSPPPKKRKPASLKLRDTIQPADCDHVRKIITATHLFRPAEIETAIELVQTRLEKGPASGYDFLFAEQKGHVVGYICFGRNTMTVSSFEVYWVAVEPGKQNQGIGQHLLAAAERHIASAGGTRVYIETSHRADYQPTRGFYDRSGYHLAAVLDDYYAPADSKATYVKLLDMSPPASL